LQDGICEKHPKRNRNLAKASSDMDFFAQGDYNKIERSEISWT
jgi:hypothetical protein